MSKYADHSLSEICVISEQIKQINYVFDRGVARNTFVVTRPTSQHTRPIFFFNKIDWERITYLVHEGTELVYLPEAYGKRVIAR